MKKLLTIITGTLLFAIPTLASAQMTPTNMPIPDDAGTVASTLYMHAALTQASIPESKIVYLENVFTQAIDPMLDANPFADIWGSLYHIDAHPGNGGLYGPGGQFEDAWNFFEDFTYQEFGVGGMQFLAMVHAPIDDCNNRLQTCLSNALDINNPTYDWAGTAAGFGCGLGAIIFGAPTAGAGAVVVLVVCTGIGIGTDLIG